MTHSTEAPSRFVAFAIAAGLLAGPAAARGQDPVAGTFSEKVEITAVTIPVRVDLPKGAAPLRPEEIVVVEAGKTWPVLALEPVARPAAAAAERGVRPAPDSAEPAPAERPWRIVAYFDLQLAGISSVRQAAWELGGQADELAALGEVEVVVVDDAVERVLAPTRDAREIKRALRKRVADNFGQRRLVRLRREFFDQADRSIGLARRRGGFSGGGGEAALARAFAEEEARMLESRRRLAETYFAERSIPDWPQAAFIVSGGYDLQPGEFYLPLVEGTEGEEESGSTEPGSSRTLARDLDRLGQGAATDALARQLSALGWVVLPVLPYDLDTDLSSDVSVTGGERWRALMSGAPPSSGPPLAVVRHPLDPWRTISATTGGELVLDVRDLDDVVGRLGERQLLTYQAGRRRDGSLLPLEVRSTRPGVEIEAPAWVASGSPEALAGARARALLAGEAAAGELPVRVRVTTEAPDDRGQSAGRIEATVEFAPLGPAKAALTETTLRFTIAVPRPDGSVLVLHELAERADLSGRQGWIFEARIVAPAGTTGVAVVVEELTTGAWGGASGRWGS